MLDPSQKMEPTQNDLLAAVASMYYIDEMTQNAIAAELGVSRVKVYRLLKQARDEEVVEIFVNWPLRRDGDLEARLVSVFGLQEALVLQASPQARVSSLVQVGQLAASFLEERIDAGATLAICLVTPDHLMLSASSGCDVAAMWLRCGCISLFLAAAGRSGQRWSRRCCGP